MTHVEHAREDVRAHRLASDAMETNSFVNRPAIVTGVALLWMVIPPLQLLLWYALVGFGQNTRIGLTLFAALCAARMTAGIGLWRMRPYGRVLAFIFAVPLLGDYPVGTALATFWLWYFAHRGTRLLFSRKPVATLAADELRDLTSITQPRMWLLGTHWVLIVLWILSEVELIDLSWVPAPGKDTSDR